MGQAHGRGGRDAAAGRSARPPWISRRQWMRKALVLRSRATAKMRRSMSSGAAGGRPCTTGCGVAEFGLEKLREGRATVSGHGSRKGGAHGVEDVREDVAIAQLARGEAP